MLLLLLLAQVDGLTSHVLWITLPVVLTVVLTQWLAHRQSQKAMQDKDNKLAVLLENYRLHDHGEWKNSNSQGPLHAENIRFPLG